MADEVIKIRGGNTLTGEVKISGAKNSAVALIPASLMAKSGTVELEGIPDISDVATLVSLLKDLDIDASIDGDVLTVNAENAHNTPLRSEEHTSELQSRCD